MDDPGWSWPAWKFGMKSDDLYTTLHDQYNTFSYTIQDAEAFHHDVYEISSDANTAAEFHRLMAARRIQRLRELTESLESLAVEIIANPKLMATDQWQHALQLFRNKSFDTVVRFFASYIPEDYPERHHVRTPSTRSSFSETASVYTTSTKASSVDDTTSFPCTDDEYPSDDYHDITPHITEEPLDMYHGTQDHFVFDTIDAPLSPPESESTQSDDVSDDALSCGSPSTNPPSRSMSFSGSDAGTFGRDLVRRSLKHDEDITDYGTAVTPIESIESPALSTADSQTTLDTTSEAVEFEDEYDSSPAQCPEDAFDIENYSNDTQDLTFTTTSNLDTFTTSTLDLDFTPTKEAITTALLTQAHETRRLNMPSRRSQSPKPHSPSCQPLSQPSHKREGSPLQRSIGRSPEEALSKVQKAGASDVVASGRRRPKAAARRRVD